MLDNWGLQIADQSVELQGRVVDREKICLADGDFDSGQNADWGNQLTRGRAFEAVRNEIWSVLQYLNRCYILYFLAIKFKWSVILYHIGKTLLSYGTISNFNSKKYYGAAKNIKSEI